MTLGREAGSHLMSLNPIFLIEGSLLSYGLLKKKLKKDLAS